MEYTWSAALGVSLSPEEQLKRCVAASPHEKLSDDQLAGLKVVCGGTDGLVLLRTGGGKMACHERFCWRGEWIQAGHPNLAWI